MSGPIARGDVTAVSKGDVGDSSVSLTEGVVLRGESKYEGMLDECEAVSLLIR